MRWQKLIIIGAVVSIITGCGSTTSGTPPTQSNINVPEAYQVMADFDIISQYDANQMAKSGKMALAKNVGNFKTSVAGQLTNNGSMFAGFAIAQFFGGGVSLMDFFNPAVAFRSTAHANNLNKTYMFLPVDADCNKECANDKLISITQKIAEYTAENYARHLHEIGKREYRPIDVGKVEQVKYDLIFRKMGAFSRVSWAYDVVFSDIEEPYSDELNTATFLAVYDADFIYVNGQKYYGSRVSSSESFNVYLRLLGWPETKVRDNSMILAMARASKEDKFIYIDTIRDYPKLPNGEYKVGKGVQSRVLGDFMIKDGKYIQLGIYPHPDNHFKDLDKMNYLDVKIGHALDDLVEEVLAEEAASSSGGAMTPSSETD